MSVVSACRTCWDTSIPEIVSGGRREGAEAGLPWTTDAHAACPFCGVCLWRGRERDIKDACGSASSRLLSALRARQSPLLALLLSAYNRRDRCAKPADKNGSFCVCGMDNQRALTVAKCVDAVGADGGLLAADKRRGGHSTRDRVRTLV